MSSRATKLVCLSWVKPAEGSATLRQRPLSRSQRMTPRPNRTIPNPPIAPHKTAEDCWCEVLFPSNVTVLALVGCAAMQVEGTTERDE